VLCSVCKNFIKIRFYLYRDHRQCEHRW